MKKVSTAAVKQSRNFSEQSLTIRLDLGDRSSHYCVLDEKGRILVESKVATSPNAMKGVFGSMAISLKIHGRPFLGIYRQPSRTERGGDV